MGSACVALRGAFGMLQGLAMQSFRLMYPHIGSLIGLFRLCGYCSESRPQALMMHRYCLFLCFTCLIWHSPQKGCFLCRTTACEAAHGGCVATQHPLRQRSGHHHAHLHHGPSLCSLLPHHPSLCAGLLHHELVRAPHNVPHSILTTQMDLPP